MAICIRLQISRDLFELVYVLIVAHHHIDRKLGT